MVVKILYGRSSTELAWLQFNFMYMISSKCRCLWHIFYVACILAELCALWCTLVWGPVCRDTSHLWQGWITLVATLQVFWQMLIGKQQPETLNCTLLYTVLYKNISIFLWNFDFQSYCNEYASTKPIHGDAFAALMKGCWSGVVVCQCYIVTLSLLSI